MNEKDAIRNRSIDSTNTLKGVAILAVLINHYLNMNFSGDYRGFANIWVFIFFMLSGYGIQYSLSKRRPSENNRFIELLRFYYLRIMRIMPLFWCAYIAESLYLNKEISLLALLGVNAPGHYWFIPAILQCYAVAPIAYYFIERYRPVALYALFVGFILLNACLYYSMALKPLTNFFEFLHLGWRNMYFLYIFVFIFSMALPKTIDCWNTVSKSEKSFYLSLLFGFAMLFMITTKFKTHLPFLYNISMTTISPMVLLLIASIFLIDNRIAVPGISTLGLLSYPIYLFHKHFILLVNALLGSDTHSLFQIGVLVVLFPLFIYLCRKLEYFAVYLLKVAPYANKGPA